MSLGFLVLGGACGTSTSERTDDTKRADDAKSTDETKVSDPVCESDADCVMSCVSATDCCTNPCGCENMIHRDKHKSIQAAHDKYCADPVNACVDDVGACDPNYKLPTPRCRGGECVGEFE